MTIRPIDHQTLIPKITELQKAKSIESDMEKNNLNINMHKEQQQNEKESKQVIQTKKTEGLKVERDGEKKNKQSKQKNGQQNNHAEENDNQDKNANGKPLTRIDIRI